ncbi:MAG: TIGR04290 family methyltransferase, partial [Chloroflexi bacterium]
MNLEAIRSRVAEIQWFHNYEVVPGVMTNGVSDMQTRGRYFEIPQDLSGKRVLDIGAADGYFSFLA